jgi:hypothetical protein
MTWSSVPVLQCSVRPEIYIPGRTNAADYVIQTICRMDIDHSNLPDAVGGNH